MQLAAQDSLETCDAAHNVRVAEVPFDGTSSLSCHSTPTNRLQSDDALLCLVDSFKRTGKTQSYEHAPSLSLQASDVVFSHAHIGQLCAVPLFGRLGSNGGLKTNDGRCDILALCAYRLHFLASQVTPRSGLEGCNARFGKVELTTGADDALPGHTTSQMALQCPDRVFVLE
jgi:hypothetical protein